jgi:hypothetical protein
MCTIITSMSFTHSTALIEIKLNTVSVELRCLKFLTVTAVIVWTMSNPEIQKGFVTKINYMDSVTKRSYVKMLIT